MTNTNTRELQAGDRCACQQCLDIDTFTLSLLSHRPAPAPQPADAPDVWSDAWPPGGWVCETCGTPTESEPCQAHQPAAWEAMS